MAQNNQNANEESNRSTVSEGKNRIDLNNENDQNEPPWAYRGNYPNQGWYNPYLLSNNPFGESVSLSSTDISSGSALFTGYSSTVYEKIQSHDVFAPEDPDEKKIYEGKIREIYLDELVYSSEAAKNDRRRSERYGGWIFGIATGMTILGILFSAWQFIIAIRIGDFSNLSTTLEFQKAGAFVITTSAIGAFVLILSLAFFFLFLNYVYKPRTKKSDLFPHIIRARDLINK